MIWYTNAAGKVLGFNPKAVSRVAVNSRGVVIWTMDGGSWLLEGWGEDDIRNAMEA